MALTKINLPSGIVQRGTNTILGAGELFTTGKVYYVDSVTGSDGNVGTDPSTPKATIDGAINACAANKGDTIIVFPKHAETISAAGGITADIAGVSIIGIGEGADRPTLTFSATTSSVLITASSVKIKNIIGKPSIDSVTNPFHVQAADVELDIEWQDASSTVEAVRAILGNASADRLNVKLKYIGNVSGNAVVNAVRLVGTNNARIDVDFYGVASTAVVEFVTTACTDVTVTGYMYNSGTTDGTKNIIDTVTGSTWFADFYDGAAGQSYSGGSAAALASDDVSSINSKVGTITNTGGTATIGAVLGDFANTTLISKLDVPSADATSNVDVSDVVGNKTDASVYVPGTTKSVAAYLKGTSDLQERVAKKTAATMTNGQTLFTVAGGPIIVLGLVSICETANDGTASTLQYSATPTVGSAQTISAASASLASAAAGASVSLIGTSLTTAALLGANGPNLGMTNMGGIMVPAGTITAVIGVGSTTGTWAHYLRYKPLATGVTVS